MQSNKNKGYRYMSKIEIAVVSKMKQGYIYKHMIENNISANELSRRSGINNVILGKIINFKWIPSRSNYQCKKTIEKLENYFKVPIEMLFPYELTQEIADKLSKKYIHIHEIETVSLGNIDTKYLEYNPQDSIDEEREFVDMGDRINKALGTLCDKEVAVLKARFGINEEPKTQAQIAKIYNITNARVGQIENRAIKKLQSKERISILKIDK